MKRILITLLALVPCIASAQVQPWSLWHTPTGSSYSFTGTLQNDSHLTTQNFPTGTFVGSGVLSGQGIKVGGSTDAVSFGDVGDDGSGIAPDITQGASFAAWVNVSATNVTGFVVAKLADGSCSSSARQFYMAVAGGKLRLIYYGAPDGSAYRGYDSDGTIAPNTWTHVAGQYTSGGAVSLWINGQPQTETLTLTFGAATLPINSTAYFGVGNPLTAAGAICGSPTSPTVYMKCLAMSTANLTDSVVRRYYEDTRPFALQ